MVIAGGAVAADLPLKAPPPVYRAFSWTGCYVGAQWGWGWGTMSGAGFTSQGTLESRGSFSNKVSGALFGGQLGCNWQFVGTNFVVGLQGSAVASDINGIGLDGTSNVRLDRNKIDSIYDATVRLGWNGWDPNVLFYVKGGWAGMHSRNLVQARFTDVVPINFSANGWTAGGGVEWAFTFAPRWSAFVEYDHYDFKAKAFNVDSTGTGTRFTNIKGKSINTIKIGVNYRLWSQY
jgi:outer membrane immunogenic protein